MRAVSTLVDGWEEDPEGTPGAETYVLQLHTFVRPGTLAPAEQVEPVETEARP
jgi:hypothetical protein